MFFLLFFALSFLFPFFFPYVMEKDKKTRFKQKKKFFDQRTACGAPICWSKYTTPAISEYSTSGFHYKNVYSERKLLNTNRRLGWGRKISIERKGALIQLSINFELSFWEIRKYKLCITKQLIKKLIDNRVV